MKKSALRVFCALLPVCFSATLAQAQGPTLDPSFAIVRGVAQASTGTPMVYDVARQPDGKFIVASNFVAINGVPVSSVCRLLPNGQVDGTFRAAVTGFVLRVALQADGKIVIAGGEMSVDGQPTIGIARLLPDGTRDASLTSSLGRTPFYSSTVNKVVLQPGVGIFVFGDLVLPGNATAANRMARLTEAGALDPTFPTNMGNFDLRDALPLPNGRLVFASSLRRIGAQWYSVWGTLPDGTLDPGFTPLPSQGETQGLVRDPATGNIYVAQGVRGARGAGLDMEPVRLLPNGVRDPSFNTTGAFVAGPIIPNTLERIGNVASLALQPNGRVLLGGTFATSDTTFFGSWRLLPSGARDPSYQVGNGPGPGVYQVLVQPDGALLFGGSFNQAGGFALNALARMRDPNVLAARAPTQADDELLAWPVPAHDALHLRLPPGRRAQQAALLDALGRVVRRQALAEGQPAPTLPTAGLAPGAYLLRVAFAEGPPAYRRVALE